MAHTAEITHWRTSSYSNDTGNCVEIGSSPTTVGIRDSKDRSLGPLTVSRTAWTHFLHTIQTGSLHH